MLRSEAPVIEIPRFPTTASLHQPLEQLMGEQTLAFVLECDPTLSDRNLGLAHHHLVNYVTKGIREITGQLLERGITEKIDAKKDSGMHNDAGFDLAINVHTTFNGRCDALLLRDTGQLAVESDIDYPRNRSFYERQQTAVDHWNSSPSIIDEELMHPEIWRTCLGRGDTLVFVAGNNAAGLRPRSAWHQFVSETPDRLSYVSFLFEKSL